VRNAKTWKKFWKENSQLLLRVGDDFAHLFQRCRRSRNSHAPDAEDDFVQSRRSPPAPLFHFGFAATNELAA
jgi:hypothetical protein